MKEIELYSGGGVISRIIFGGNGSDVSADIAAIFGCIPSGAGLYAVVDRRACGASAFVAALADALGTRGAQVYMADVSEERKTMESVMAICGWLMEKGADRDALVLAVGGGITTDMAGFAASIYKRGVRFAYVPTTLLAQVDAAAGGKTGVNFDRYKNMLGVIRQPEFTFVSAGALLSLPQRDLLSGAAEMLKSFIIEDGGNYAAAVDFLKDLRRRGSMEGGSVEQLEALVAAALRVKAGIVSRDQFEQGERRKLNLGHTFAHAIETLARRRCMDITHGEAVSIGIVSAARLSEAVRDAQPEVQPGLAEMLENDLKQCGLPVECPFSIGEMAAVMSKDKKAEKGKVHFVLPRAIGDVAVVDFTVEEVCRIMES